MVDTNGQNIHNLVLQKYELAYYKSIVEIWNSRHGRLADFPKYLKAAYNNRVVFCNPSDVDVIS
jgi:hypothetical protein